MEISEEDIIMLVEERMDGDIESLRFQQLEQAILENPQTRDKYLDLIRLWLDLQTMLDKKSREPCISKRKIAP